MTAKIIPFPLSVERQVMIITGTNDFHELLQLRADLTDRLFSLVDQGDLQADKALREIGGETVMEQIVALYRYYPYWNEWNMLHVKT